MFMAEVFANRDLNRQQIISLCALVCACVYISMGVLQSMCVCAHVCISVCMRANDSVHTLNVRESVWLAKVGLMGWESVGWQLSTGK